LGHLPPSPALPPPPHFNYFSKIVSPAFLAPGQPKTQILPISASRVAEIVGMPPHPTHPGAIFTWAGSEEVPRPCLQHICMCPTHMCLCNSIYVPRFHQQRLIYHEANRVETSGLLSCMSPTKGLGRSPRTLFTWSSFFLNLPKSITLSNQLWS
jgi:hypothetical protein